MIRSKLAVRLGRGKAWPQRANTMLARRDKDLGCGKAKRLGAATRLERAKTMGLVWALLALALHFVPGAVDPARAQGTRKDDIVFNSRGIPLAGAAVRVCAMPATGQPCAPLAQIYSDSALTQALANPTTADGLGNYFFYAAPGQYEIEISGPGITTKQIPNVILPNDPSSPSFSGAISAFSLNLSGNLSVTGNTSILGNLASGTLNLSNQSAPPGAAGAGTVNLYTKSADKRLYYKDDTGTEIGPIAGGSGAQTNVTNTFTAPQNFDSDLHTKGPNPYYDLARYGGYPTAAGSYSNGVPSPNTTGSITSGSTTLTLSSALDFLNGHGILVSKAGKPTTLVTPTVVTVTPGGILNGATTYTYQLVAEDYAGGLTAASSSVSTTTGAATLGINTASITTIQRASGTATYTTAAAHNFQAGQSVFIPNNLPDSSFSGTFTIVATPTSTTFTVDQTTHPNVSATGVSGQAEVAAFNIVTCSAQANALRYWVYRNGALTGVIVGNDCWYQDYGFGLNANNSNFQGTPFYVPTTPPSSAQPGYLATTIANGGGTTSLTLAASANSTVSGAIVIHDNTPNLLEAINASNFSGTVYLSSPGIWQFNSVMLPPASGNGQVRLLVNASVELNEPWVLRNNYIIEGEAFNVGGSAFFYSDGAVLEGGGYPLIEATGAVTNNNAVLRRLVLQCTLHQQPCYNSDQIGGSTAPIGQTFENVAFTGGAYNTLAVIRNEFDTIFRGGSCQGSQGSQQQFYLPCMRFTNVTRSLSGSGSNTPGRVRFSEFDFQNTGVQFDNLPDTTSGNATDFLMNSVLYESGLAPLLRFNVKQVWQNLSFIEVYPADLVACCGTPTLDFSGSTSTPQVYIQGGSAATGNESLATGNINVVEGGAVQPYVYTGIANSVVSPYGFTNTAFTMSGNSSILAAISQPAAPTLATSGSSGPAAGTYYYWTIPVDVNGGLGPLSPPSSITVNGSQGVLVSWTPVAGQVYTDLCRGIPGNFNCNLIGGQAFHVAGNSFLDVGTNFWTNSPPTYVSGGSNILSSQGVSASGFTETSGGYAITHSTPSLTGNRTYTNPDVSGVIPITGYQNSAYDNFNRANGAIGASWTVQQNGLNVSANQVVGTTVSASNTAFWNANGFGTTQFSQVTVTALNGTSDYPGVTVFASGTGGSANYYDCVENSANIYLQRIQNAGITSLGSAASAGNAGDVLRLEMAPGGALTCYKNGAVALTATDTVLTSGSPGVFISGNVATVDNWSGGNLHPLAQLDAQQDWIKLQNFTQGVQLGGESFTASPRGVQSAFLPGALTSTWTGSTWTLDKAITVTRVQVQAKTAPAGCSTSAVVRLTDGTSPVNVTVNAAANDSGAIAQSYAAGASLTVALQTAAAGCSTSPADANVLVQYKMQ